MKKFLSLLFLTVFVSCTTDDEIFENSNGKAEECNVPIHFSVKCFKGNGGSATRGYLDDKNISDGDMFNYNFYLPDDGFEGDQFGILCLNNGETVPLSLVRDTNAVVPADTLSADSLSKDKFNFDASLTTSGFLRDGYNYVVYYPYEGRLRYCTDVMYMYNGDACSQDVRMKNYFVSDVLNYDGNLGGFTEFYLYPLNSAIHLGIKSDDPVEIKSIGLVNVDGMGNFRNRIWYEATSDGVQANEEDSHDSYTNELSMRLNNVLLKEDRAVSFSISSYPTNTGEFVLRIVTTDNDTLYSEQTYPSIDMAPGYWYVIECDRWTKEKPYYAYTDIEKNTGMYYVDLGLPNVYWALQNIGANDPTQPGTRFASKDENTAFNMYKGKWRTPTAGNFAAMCKSCYWEYTKNYKGTGVAGYMVFKTDEDGYVVKNNTGLHYSAMNGDGGKEPANQYWCYDYHRGRTPDKVKGHYDPYKDVHIFLPCTEQNKKTAYYMTTDLDYSKKNYFRFEFREGQPIPEIKRIKRIAQSVIRPVFTYE